MIFSELYGAYYNTVAAILRASLREPINNRQLQDIIRENAFSESILAIEPALAAGKWPLWGPDGRSILAHEPTMPLTTLQKRWLKAVSLDPRVCLFDFPRSGLADVEPLFRPEDIYVYDRYADGDPFTDPEYIRRFRLILQSVRQRQPLAIELQNRRNELIRLRVLPDFLEYSEKDDKFRLVTTARHYGRVINLARITSCSVLNDPGFRSLPAAPPACRTVVIELYDGRNSLERALLHFAHFEKEAQRLDSRRYRITIRYQRDDETEMVIRVLSFGPFIKVTDPPGFVELIRDRLRKQKSCEPHSK